MRNLYKSLLIGAAGLTMCASLASCEDYLEKAPETTVSGDDAFKNFRNFQGFIEEVYNCIPDKEKCNWCPSWNWGDDEVFNPEADDRMTHQADLGNFRAWYQTGNWLYKSGSNPNDGNAFNHSLWPHSWYCIRKCNMAIENIDKLTGTKEEKNLILGQAYFFRAWWHFELMEYFGGLPYIDKVFDANDELKEKRLSYQETADRVAEDLQKAIELLPIDWDATVAGASSSGKNQLRVNKITALGYLGKNYLWAGSPLMKNGAKLGGTLTYDYDEAYCQKAAEAFGELLNLVESNQTQYALVEFNYGSDMRDIYDHKRAKTAKTCYSDLFYTVGNSWQMPGSTEAIMQGPSGSGGNANNSNWNTSKVFGPKVAGIVEHDNVIHQPTGNLVEMYGMENGLPIDDPNSGFDPNHPWLNRDPRFYHDIVFDGFKYLNGAAGDRAQYTYCDLQTDGALRPVANGSRTGYFCQKLIPHTCNIVDKDYDWSGALHCYLSYMRLADIYLMYAEACNAVGGPTYKSSNFDKNAIQAINTIRARCGAGPVGGKKDKEENATRYAYSTSGGDMSPELATDKNKFMDEIRRERAVELAFEGFRFNDLQRWLLLTEPKYCMKYSNEFKRVTQPADDVDPRFAEVAGYTRKEILTRKFGTQHYWFPFPNSEVYLYKEFEQNPGW